MIYRVPSRNSYGEHCGFTYHTNKRDALKAWKTQMLEECDETGKTRCNAVNSYMHTDTQYWKKGTGFDPFDDEFITDRIELMPTPKNQADLLHMLYWWAGHPDNG
tara:strand:- start:349 stop:663 length:315 start_codon:yes stop_codon:yes gene_type:complete